MNQLELNNEHRQNPKPGDDWSNHVRENMICLVLDVLTNGNVILTSKVNHAWDGKEYITAQAREVTKEDFMTMVEHREGLQVRPFDDHYLVQCWNRRGRIYEEIAVHHVDPRITERYLIILHERGHMCRENIFDRIDGDHLVWMVSTIQRNELSSQTKAHRWLGFVQSALISMGYTSMREERDFTRGIFNGA